MTSSLGRRTSPKGSCDADHVPADEDRHWKHRGRHRRAGAEDPRMVDNRFDRAAVRCARKYGERRDRHCSAHCVLPRFTTRGRQSPLWPPQGGTVQRDPGRRDDHHRCAADHARGVSRVSRAAHAGRATRRPAGERPGQRDQCLLVLDADHARAQAAVACAGCGWPSPFHGRHLLCCRDLWGPCGDPVRVECSTL